MSDLEKNLDLLLNKLTDSSFFKGDSLGGEQNIHFACYNPDEEFIIRNFIEEKIQANPNLKHVQIIDLYKLFMDLVEEDDLYQDIVDCERENNTKYIRESIAQDAIPPSRYKDKIVAQKQDNTILILTKVGEIYPFLRIHGLLEELQQSGYDNPIIVMYPGVYNRRSIKLFNKLSSTNYYRAFNMW